MDILNFILQRPVEGIVVFCIGLAVGFVAGYRLKRWGYEEKIHFLEAKVQRLEEEVNLWQSVDTEDEVEENSVADKQDDKQKQEVSRGQKNADEKYGEKYWLDEYPDALECARWYNDLLSRFYTIQEIRYVSIITIYIGGLVRVAVRWRKSDQAALFHIRYKEGNMDEAVSHLTSEGIPVIVKENNLLVFAANLKQLKEKLSVHEWIAKRLCPQHLTIPKR